MDTCRPPFPISPSPISHTHTHTSQRQVRGGRGGAHQRAPHLCRRRRAGGPPRADPRGHQDRCVGGCFMCVYVYREVCVCRFESCVHASPPPPLTPSTIQPSNRPSIPPLPKNPHPLSPFPFPCVCATKQESSSPAASLGARSAAWTGTSSPPPVRRLFLGMFLCVLVGVGLRRGWWRECVFAYVRVRTRQPTLTPLLHISISPLPQLSQMFFLFLTDPSPITLPTPSLPLNCSVHAH